MNTIEELNEIGSTAVEEEEIGKRQTLLVLSNELTKVTLNIPTVQSRL